jgi:pilus assembly protein CpaE
MHAYFLGTPGRHIEELFHACGVRATLKTPEDLSSPLASSGPLPDVVVLDLRDGQSVPMSVGIFKRQHPTIGVLILAATLDPTLMLEAMRAGVSEFVTEPLTAAVLQAALDRVVAKGAMSDPGRVFAFVGGKGGVGTTTLAVNVAAALAAPQSSTLLIDLHLAYGDAAVFLGTEPRFSVVDALENVDRLDEAFLRSVVGKTKFGVDVLASADRTMMGHLESRAVRALIDCAMRHYQYVVVDVPRSGAAILDALDAASQVVVVANQELATVRSAARMATALRQRYGRERVPVVVSRFDQVAEIGRKDIERVIGGPIADVFPSNYRHAIEALNHGRPLVLDNQNKLAAAYTAFARGLIGDVRRTAPERDRTPGLLARLSLRSQSPRTAS